MISSHSLKYSCIPPVMNSVITTDFLRRRSMPASWKISSDALSGDIASTGGLDNCHAPAPAAGSKPRSILKRLCASFPHQPWKRGRSPRPW
jgi:hypothetical protein